jgi:hypothetical protein
MESRTKVNMVEKEFASEQEDVQTPRPLSARKSDVDIEDVENGPASERSALPFSKARCITLVATVTGAAFLNVRVPQYLISSPIAKSSFAKAIRADFGSSSRCHHSSHDRQSS